MSLSMAAPAAHSEGPLATAGAMVPTKETNLQRRKRIQREQTFPFFDLPREVRNMVYAEMAESTQTVRTRGRRQHYTLADYGYPKARLINREFKVEYDEERQKHGRVIIHEASQRLGRIINSLVQLTHVAAFRYLPVRHVFIERIFWVYLQDKRLQHFTQYLENLCDWLPTLRVLCINIKPVQQPGADYAGDDALVAELSETLPQHVMLIATMHWVDGVNSG